VHGGTDQGGSIQKNHKSEVVSLFFFRIVRLPCMYSDIPKLFFQDYRSDIIKWRKRCHFL